MTTLLQHGSRSECADQRGSFSMLSSEEHLRAFAGTRANAARAVRLGSASGRSSSRFALEPGSASTARVVVGDVSNPRPDGKLPFHSDRS
jgi:hypothetical protein